SRRQVEQHYRTEALEQVFRAVATDVGPRSVVPRARQQRDPPEVVAQRRRGIVLRDTLFERDASRLAHVCAAVVQHLGVVEIVREAGVELSRSDRCAIRGNQIDATLLKSEKADTWTVGAVIRSPFNSGPFSRLNLPVDSFNITIN